MAANRVELGRFGFSVLVGLSAAILTGCAQKPPPAPPQTAAIQPPPPPPAPPVRRRVFPLPPHKPEPPPDSVGLGAEAGSETALLDNTGPGARTPSASELIGLDQAAATRLFGAASEQTDAPPATIWRYRGANCELELTFYLDLRSGKMRALHYAFKGEPADPAGRQNCLRSLVVARR